MRNIRYLLIIGIISIVLPSLQAEVISIECARQIGMDWFARDSDRNEKAPFRKKSTSTLTHIRSGKNDSFHIFNREEGGYIIVSGDDSMNPVIGYSYEDMWNDKDVPPFVEEILQHFSESCSDRAGDFGLSEERTQTRASRGSVLHNTAKWDQSEPFNNLLGNDYPIGCVGLAMAIVLRYYESPLPGYGTNSYEWNGKTYSFDYNRTFNWEDMPLAEPSGGYSVKQATALSELAYACAVASYTSFSPEGSGAIFRPYSIQKFFNYSPDVMTHDSYSMKLDWAKELLYEELDAGRLAVVSGGGHCFVCDGYEDNYFHFNFGWGGSSNGYFMLSSLTPLKTGYPDVDLITGIHPLAEPTTTANPWRIMGYGNKDTYGLNVNAEKIIKGESYSFVINYLMSQTENDRFEGEIGLALCNSNHEIKSIIASEYLNLGCSYYTFSKYFNVTITDDLEEDDVILVVGRPAGSEEWWIIPVEKGLRKEISVANTGIPRVPIIWDFGFANYEYYDFGNNNSGYPGYSYDAYAEFPSANELKGYIIDGEPKKGCSFVCKADDKQHVIRPVSFPDSDALYGQVLSSEGENNITDRENKDDFIRIKELKVKGDINESDVKILCDMPYLSKLDLRDAHIGGRNPNVAPDALFWYNNNIEKVVMPKTLTALGRDEFYNSSVKSIHLGPDLKTIGAHALSSASIEELIVEMPTPIPLEYSDIEHIDFEKAILYIPKNKRTLYRNNYAWKYFKNIQEMDFSSVSDMRLDKNDIKFDISKGLLSVSSSDQPIQIELYRIDGVKMFSDVVIDMKRYELEPGIYILKSSSGQGYKINIK